MNSKRAWIFGGLDLGLFFLLGLVVHFRGRPCFDWDIAVSRMIQSIHWHWVDDLMHAVSMADNNVFGPALLVGAACLVLLTQRAWRETALLLGLVFVGQLLWVVSGYLVARPRPSAELVRVLIEENNVHGFPSFPSGHTEYYTIFFGFLWFLVFTRVQSPPLRWPLLIVFGGLIGLIGIARLYLGAHWVSDVLGGYLLGAAVLGPGIDLYKRMNAAAAWTRLTLVPTLCVGTYVWPLCGPRCTFE